MNKFLKFIWVLHEKSNKGLNPKLGRGYLTAYKLNPYNPLTYVVIILGLFVFLLLYGFVGVKKEFSFVNPFKWN